jgi:thioredoxin 1
MSESNLVYITDENFQDTIKEANKPVLVDFYADWCGPCQMVAPIMEELAEKYQDQVVVAKMNIDQNRETPGEYQVMSIPTVILFHWKNDQVTPLAKKTGFIGADVYTKMIEEALA